MTLPLIPVEDRQVQLNFDKLAQQFPIAGQNLANDVLRLAATGTSRKIAFGSSTVTFSASAEGTKAVTHNLGATPTAILALPVLATGESLFCAVRSGATSTSATFQFRTDDATAISATFTFYWAVLG